MVRGKGGRIGNPRTFRFIFIAIYRLLPPFSITTRRTTIPVNSCPIPVTCCPYESLWWSVTKWRQTNKSYTGWSWHNDDTFNLMSVSLTYPRVISRGQQDGTGQRRVELKKCMTQLLFFLLSINKKKKIKKRWPEKRACNNCLEYGSGFIRQEDQERRLSD